MNQWDFSRGVITHEAGEEGTWSDKHWWSKFLGAEGVVELATGELGSLATKIRHVPSSALNQTYKLGLKSTRASILQANRKIYGEFVNNGGKLIVKRDVIKLGDNGAQILGEFNSVNKTITLYRDSNLSTISEELIHFMQIQGRGLLGKRIPKSLIAGLENDAATVLQQWGFVPR